MEWRYRKIGEIAELTKGRTPSRKNSRYFSQNTEDIPWVKIENLGRREVSSSEEYLTPEGAGVGKMIPAGAVLLSVNKTIGKTGIAAVPLQTNEQIMAISLKTEEVLPEYLYYYFLFAEKQLQQLAYITVGKRIGRDTLADLVIPIPPSAEQRQWVELLRRTEDYLQKKRDMRLLLRRIREQGDKGERKELWEEFLFRENIPARWEALDELLGKTAAAAERLLQAVLSLLLREGNRDKEKRYYEEEGHYRTEDPFTQLDQAIQAILGRMSAFQQELYKQFLQAREPAAIHEMLKQLKRKSPEYGDYSIQDALAAVEVFRLLGLMAESRQEILDESGADESLHITLWQCRQTDGSNGNEAFACGDQKL